MCYISKNMETGLVKFETVHEGPRPHENDDACKDCIALQAAIDNHLVTFEMTRDMGEIQVPVISYADALHLASLVSVALDKENEAIARLAASDMPRTATEKHAEYLGALLERLKSIGSDGLYAPPF